MIIASSILFQSYLQQQTPVALLPLHSPEEIIQPQLQRVDWLPSLLQTGLEEGQQLSHRVNYGMRSTQERHVGHFQDGEEVVDCIYLSLVGMAWSDPCPLNLIDNLLDAAVGEIHINKFLKSANRIDQFQLQGIFRMHNFVFDIDQVLLSNFSPLVNWVNHIALDQL